MKLRSSRTFQFTFMAFLLAALPALGQEELIETKWTVDEKGELLVHPHPANSREQNEQGVGRELWILGRGGKSLGEVLIGGGLTSMMRFAAPGAVDLASHCDIEFHFKKLGLGLTDEDLIRRIAADPARLDIAEPLRRRARLDRLLAVRLAARRSLALAKPVLRAIVRDSDADPFLRRAAWEGLARAGSAWLYPFDRRLPPLLPILAGIPDSADLVAVINQARCPRWEGIAALAREFGLAQAQKQVERLGAAVTPRDLLAGQLSIEHAAEQFYELARKFGNMRIDRTVLAMDLDQRATFRIRWDGIFEAAQLRRALEEVGAEVAIEGDRVLCILPDGMGTMEFTPRRFEVVLGEWSGRPGGTLLATELGLAGAAEGEAIWLHLRNPAVPEVVHVFRGLASGTLVISFDRGIECRMNGEYVHAAMARRAGKEIREMFAEVPEDLGILRPGLTVIGPRLKLFVSLEGESAEDVFRRLLRMR